MNDNGLIIVAKRNNQEVYLLEYKLKKGSGFIADLANGVRYPDDSVQAIRKKGFWVDIQCSKNVGMSILRKVAGLKMADLQHQ